MRNRFIKILIFTVIVFSTFFFCNMSKVNAECYCYYYGVRETSSVNNTTTTEYYLKMVYDTNQADVVEFCSGNSCQNYLSRCSTDGCYDVDSAYISNLNCSVDACKSAGLYLQGNSTSSYKATTDLTGVKFNAITQATYESDTESLARNYSEDISDIVEWGESTTSSLYSASDYDTCDLIAGEIKDLIEMVLTWISIAGIVILLIMSIMEFVKALTAGDAEGKLTTAFRNTLIRIACVAILLLLPMLISALIDVVNDNNYQEDDDGSYMIGSEGEPLCKINKNN